VSKVAGKNKLLGKAKRDVQQQSRDTEVQTDPVMILPQQMYSSYYYTPIVSNGHSVAYSPLWNSQYGSMYAAYWAAQQQQQQHQHYQRTLSQLQQPHSQGIARQGYYPYYAQHYTNSTTSLSQVPAQPQQQLTEPRAELPTEEDLPTNKPTENQATMEIEEPVKELNMQKVGVSNSSKQSLPKLILGSRCML
jgi:hypothetical protein